MIWKWLGALLLFPVQMVYLVVKAALCMVLPPKLRDLSGDNVLVTGGGRGIGRHLAREFAKRGARKVSTGVMGRGGSSHLPLLNRGVLRLGTGKPLPSPLGGIDGSTSGRGEEALMWKIPGALSHYLDLMSEVAHSSFPASCLSPSHPRKREGEKGAPGEVSSGDKGEVFAQRRLPAAGRAALCASQREASAHLHFCLRGCFLAALVAGTVYKQRGSWLLAPALQAEHISSSPWAQPACRCHACHPRGGGLGWRRGDRCVREGSGSRS